MINFVSYYLVKILIWGEERNFNLKNKIKKSFGMRTAKISLHLA
jgi:hypothetical protein